MSFFNLGQTSLELLKAGQRIVEPQLSALRLPNAFERLQSALHRLESLLFLILRPGDDRDLIPDLQEIGVLRTPCQHQSAGQP